MTTEAGQEEKAGWPVVEIGRLRGKDGTFGEGLFIPSWPEVARKDGVPLERYLPQGTVTGLVEALDERKLKALALELPESVYDDAITPILTALSAYKQETGECEGLTASSTPQRRSGLKSATASTTSCPADASTRSQSSDSSSRSSAPHSAGSSSPPSSPGSSSGSCASDEKDGSDA
jgi:hypothetical protein